MRFDPKFLDSMTADNLDNWRNLWQPTNHFNFDTRNKVIIFEDVIFKDGTGAGALILFPNQNVGDAPAEITGIAVPNANAVITAAPVRASLCFAAEVYSKFFGSGIRAGAVYVSGLNYHVLSNFGAFGNEIPYRNNKGADEIAEEAGLAALTGQNILQSGGFTRVGSAGMSLNGSIDRITVRLQFEGGGDRDGISETIDYAKERPPIHFESERELERRGRIPDALQKIKEQKEIADQIRFTAKHLKPIKRQSQRPYQNLNHFTQTAVGAPHGGTQTFSSPDTWLAGQPVFVDGNGVPAPDGKIFRGIVVANGSTGPSIATATQGTIPVRVKGPFKTGDDIGIDTGPGQTAKKDGKLPLGKVNASYTGNNVVTVPVRLGAGGSAGDPDITFFLSDATETEGDPPEESNKVLVADGKIDGEFPDGMGSSEYILDLETPEDSLIYAGATFNPETLAITSRFLGVSRSDNFPEARIDEEGGFLYWLLGYTFFDDDEAFRIIMVRTGDIHTELIYGSSAGQPALWAGDEIGWLDY
jgi:hypothetical protein